MKLDSTKSMIIKIYIVAFFVALVIGRALIEIGVEPSIISIIILIIVSSFGAWAVLESVKAERDKRV